MEVILEKITQSNIMCDHKKLEVHRIVQSFYYERFKHSLAQYEGLECLKELHNVTSDANNYRGNLMSILRYNAEFAEKYSKTMMNQTLMKEFNGSPPFNFNQEINISENLIKKFYAESEKLHKFWCNIKTSIFSDAKCVCNSKKFNRNPQRFAVKNKIKNSVRRQRFNDTNVNSGRTLVPFRNQLFLQTSIPNSSNAISPIRLSQTLENSSQIMNSSLYHQTVTSKNVYQSSNIGTSRNSAFRPPLQYSNNLQTGNVNVYNPETSSILSQLHTKNSGWTNGSSTSCWQLSGNAITTANFTASNSNLSHQKFETKSVLFPESSSLSWQFHDQNSKATSNSVTPYFYSSLKNFDAGNASFPRSSSFGTSSVNTNVSPTSNCIKSSLGYSQTMYSNPQTNQIGDISVKTTGTPSTPAAVMPQLSYQSNVQNFASDHSYSRHNRTEEQTTLASTSFGNYSKSEPSSFGYLASTLQPQNFGTGNFNIVNTMPAEASSAPALSSLYPSSGATSFYGTLSAAQPLNYGTSASSVATFKDQGKNKLLSSVNLSVSKKSVSMRPMLKKETILMEATTITSIQCKKIDKKPEFLDFDTEIESHWLKAPQNDNTFPEYAPLHNEISSMSDNTNILQSSNTFLEPKASLESTKLPQKLDAIPKSLNISEKPIIISDVSIKKANDPKTLEYFEDLLFNPLSFLENDLDLSVNSEELQMLENTSMTEANSSQKHESLPNDIIKCIETTAPYSLSEISQESMKYLDAIQNDHKLKEESDVSILFQKSRKDSFDNDETLLKFLNPPQESKESSLNEVTTSPKNLPCQENNDSKNDFNYYQELNEPMILRRSDRNKKKNQPSYNYSFVEPKISKKPKTENKKASRKVKSTDTTEDLNYNQIMKSIISISQNPKDKGPEDFQNQESEDTLEMPCVMVHKIDVDSETLIASDCPEKQLLITSKKLNTSRNSHSKNVSCSPKKSKNRSKKFKKDPDSDESKNSKTHSVISSGKSNQFTACDMESTKIYPTSNVISLDSDGCEDKYCCSSEETLKNSLILPRKFETSTSEKTSHQLQENEKPSHVEEKSKDDNLASVACSNTEISEPSGLSNFQSKEQDLTKIPYSQIIPKESKKDQSDLTNIKELPVLLGFSGYDLESFPGPRHSKDFKRLQFPLKSLGTIKISLLKNKEPIKAVNASENQECHATENRIVIFKNVENIKSIPSIVTLPKTENSTVSNLLQIEDTSKSDAYIKTSNPFSSALQGIKEHQNIVQILDSSEMKEKSEKVAVLQEVPIRNEKLDSNVEEFVSENSHNNFTQNQENPDSYKIMLEDLINCNTEKPIGFTIPKIIQETKDFQQLSSENLKNQSEIKPELYCLSMTSQESVSEPSSIEATPKKNRRGRPKIIKNQETPDKPKRVRKLKSESNKNKPEIKTPNAHPNISQPTHILPSFQFTFGPFV